MTPQDAPRTAGAIPRPPVVSTYEAELRPRRRWWRDGYDVVLLECRGPLRNEVGIYGWRRHRDAARSLARRELNRLADAIEEAERPAVEVVRTPPRPKLPTRPR